MGAAQTLFRDVLFLVIGVLILVIIVLIPWINEAMRRADDVPLDEQMVWAIRWPDGMPDDVDMWLRPPEGRPVGYSGKHGPLCDLQRDDLGSPGDPLRLNYENIRCRQAVDGEYVLNLHLYTHRSKQPVPVRWALTMKVGSGTATTRRAVAGGEAVLTAQGQETTVVVILIADGRFRSSHTPVRTIPLRAAP